MSDSSSGNYALLDQLAEEFAARYRAGERPSLKEYIDRYPNLADDIRTLFPAMVEIEQAEEDRQEEEAPAEPAAPQLERLGDFRILREVGKGGMGIVYEAEQVSLGRHVALKVLPKKMLLEGKARRRFEREAKAAARLHHTNIVPVFGVGEDDGLPYYVMQFIQGLGLDEVLEELTRMQSKGATATGSLPGQALRVSRKELSAADIAHSLMTGEFKEPRSDRSPDVSRPASPASPLTAAHAPASESKPAGASSGRLSDSFTLSSTSVTLPGQVSQTASKKPTYWQSVAQIGVQVANGLEYAHKQGILHRDIKPSNLLLDTRGTVWVTDFGLAKADDQQDITHTGDILGTLRYLPPEVFEGKTDARGDIYSLGLTLYELLAFTPAFAETDRNKLIKQLTTHEPPRLNRMNPAIPRDLVTVVHKAMDRERGRRYQAAEELAADLQRFIDDEPIKARRLGLGERAWRWCRRNPVVAGLTAALVLIMAAVTVGSLIFAARFDRLAAEREVDRERAVKAQKAAEDALAEIDVQKKRAEASSQRAQKAVADLAGERHRFGLSQIKAGKIEDAIAALKDAGMLRVELAKTQDKSPAYHADLAATALTLSELLWKTGRVGEAVRFSLTGIGELKDAMRLGPNDPKLATQLLVAQRTVGESFARTGLWDEAARHYDEWLGLLDGRKDEDEPGSFIRAAVVNVAAGNIEAYRNVCACFLARFGEGKRTWEIGFVSWACNLMEKSQLPPARTLAWTDKAAAASHNEWDYFNVALAQLRAGRWQQATVAARRSLQNDYWHGKVMSYPILAMAHHKLGRSDHAQLWLERARTEYRRLGPLHRSIVSPTAMPSIPKEHWERSWFDWVTFAILYREASLLITGSPPVEDAYDLLHRGYLRTQLSEPLFPAPSFAGDPHPEDRYKPTGLFAAAVKLRPDDPEVWLARSRVFSALRAFKWAEADIVQATKLKPKDPMPWIAAGRFFAERGKHAQADAAFTKAATLSRRPGPEAQDDEIGLNRFIEGGWWVVGPYPEELRLSCAPEKDPDPSRPVASADGSGTLNWRRASNGDWHTAYSDIGLKSWRLSPRALDRSFLDLRSIFDVDNRSVYALTYIYSPRETTATLIVGGDDRVRLWLNGKLVHEILRNTVPAADRVPVTFRAGRNVLLAKVSNASRHHFLTLRIGDDLFERGLTFARLGLYEEAAAYLRKDGHQNDPETAFLEAYTRLRKGDTAGYRKVCRRLLDSSNDAREMRWALRACVLAPNAVDDPKELIRAAQKMLKQPGANNDSGVLFALAAAYLHNNEIDEAIRRGMDSANSWPPGGSDRALGYLVTALAYQRQGSLDVARTWWRRAAPYFKNAVPGKGESRHPAAADIIITWENQLIAQVLRKEAPVPLRQAKDDQDDQSREEQLRQELEKLDKATYDYGLALLFDPDDPNLWLARSRRYAELGRHKEAEADFAQAFRVRPKDEGFWREQARIYARRGDWTLAARCFATTPTAANADNGQVPFERACLFLLTGNRAAYRQLCADMLEAHAMGRGGRDFLTGRACTLAKDAVADLTPAEKVAVRELKNNNNNWALTASAGLHYRAGRFEQAAELLQRCMKENPKWDGNVLNWLWLSLVHHKLGQKPEARKWLDRATRFLDQFPTGMPTTAQSGGQGLALHDWLEALVLRREAEGSVLGKAGK